MIYLVYVVPSLCLWFVKENLIWLWKVKTSACFMEKLGDMTVEEEVLLTKIF